MKIDVLTIFPSLFDSFLRESLLGKAIESGVVDVRIHDIRGYTENRHGKVDDAPFGGGPGMVMSPQPLADAIEGVKKEGKTRTIMLTPSGKVFNQSIAAELAREDRLLLVCGRYEGMDNRIAERYADMELSIGDYVLNGGEVAAMAVMESVFRLLPGGIGKVESLASESFAEGLLEYPQYTRPEDFRGEKVPPVLLSGNHGEIEKWRRARALEKTLKVRPDLVGGKARDRSTEVRFSLALVHSPVMGNAGRSITSSVTTLDVHDFARIGRTYGAEKVYIVTPVPDQQRLVERMVSHWMREGALKGMDSRRSGALEIVEVVDSIEAAMKDARGRSGRVKTLATSAAPLEGALSPEEWLFNTGEADEWVILFGTAYGLMPDMTRRSDCRLKPVAGRGEYNHLPVRGACAIILDQLFGNWRKF